MYLEKITETCRKGKSKIMQIVNRCPNLEILEIPYVVINNGEELEHMGKKCPNLTKLKIFVPLPNNGAALAHFKKLKDLTLVDGGMELDELSTSLPQLEVLTLDTDYLQSIELDFSGLKNLRILRIGCEVPTCPLMKSLSKCKNLEELHVKKLPEEVVVQIIQGCPKIRLVACPNMQLSLDFINKVEKAMEKRPDKVVIEARDPANLIQEAQYDKRKIEFKKSSFTLNFSSLNFDSDSEYSDVSFGDDWFYNEFDDLPEEYFYDDRDFGDDLFRAAMVLAAWNAPDPDDDDDEFEDYDLY